MDYLTSAESLGFGSISHWILALHQRYCVYFSYSLFFITYLIGSLPFTKGVVFAFVATRAFLQMDESVVHEPSFAEVLNISSNNLFASTHHSPCMTPVSWGLRERYCCPSLFLKTFPPRIRKSLDKFTEPNQEAHKKVLPPDQTAGNMTQPDQETEKYVLPPDQRIFDPHQEVRRL